MHECRQDGVSEVGRPEENTGGGGGRGGLARWTGEKIKGLMRGVTEPNCFLYLTRTGWAAPAPHSMKLLSPHRHAPAGQHLRLPIGRQLHLDLGGRQPVVVVEARKLAGLHAADLDLRSTQTRASWLVYDAAKKVFPPLPALTSQRPRICAPFGGASPLPANAHTTLPSPSPQGDSCPPIPHFM